MKSIILIYKTDNLHSFKSRDLIGVANSHSKMLSICKQQAEKEGNVIDEDQLWNLNNLKQTQGYKGDGEFHCEEVNINVLL